MPARPDFFIVGAPRCGTTAMYVYLREHPEVFMPLHKEPMFFGSDLTHATGRLTEPEYLNLFKPARRGQRVGEASTWYLYSATAAREIRRFSPNAQIIIMLRDPVDMMYSLHRELVFYRAEPLTDFEEALAAESARKRGRRLGPDRNEVLYYREVARYADQVERYLAAFAAEDVHIVLLDDFVRDAAGTYAEVLRFLRVDHTHRPRFRRVNGGKQHVHAGVQELIVRPPRPIADLVPLFRRAPLAHRLRAALLAANSRPSRRRPLAPELRRQLAAELGPEVRRLQSVIGRDLSAWLPDERPAGQADIA